MLRAGVTGGIGSGKSIVCEVFRNLGIPVFSADNSGRKLLDTNKEIILKIKKTFGKNILGKRDIIDRKKLAAIVFSEPSALNKLNSILHPAIGKCFTEWVGKQRNVPYVIREAAIMFESGTHKDMDVMIAVTAPVELKVTRVMKRSGMSAEEIRKRMRSQLSDEEKVKISDYVIRNDDITPVLPQILAIHEDIISKSDSRS